MSEEEYEHLKDMEDMETGKFIEYSIFNYHLNIGDIVFNNMARSVSDYYNSLKETINEKTNENEAQTLNLAEIA